MAMGGTTIQAKKIPTNVRGPLVAPLARSMTVRTGKFRVTGRITLSITNTGYADSSGDKGCVDGTNVPGPYTK